MVRTEEAPCAQMARTTRGICTEEVFVSKEDVWSQLKSIMRSLEQLYATLYLDAGRRSTREGDTILSVVCSLLV
jgi:hypothetical protein